MLADIISNILPSGILGLFIVTAILIYFTPSIMFMNIISSMSPSDITAVAELGLLIVTFFLGVLTWKNVQVSKENVQVAAKLVEMQINPFVYITAEWDDSSVSQLSRSFYIVIKNSGGGIARNINFGDITDDFQVISSIKADQSTAKPPTIEYTTFKQLPIIKKGIEELAPHQKISLLWFELWRISEIKNSVKVTFEYENLIGEKKQGENIIDFPSYARSLEQH